MLAFINIPGLFVECPEIEIHTLRLQVFIITHYLLGSVFPTRCQKHTIDVHILSFFAAAHQDIQDVIDLICSANKPLRSLMQFRAATSDWWTGYERWMEDDLKVKNVIEEREEEVYTVQVFISGIPLYLSQSSDLTQQINFFRLQSVQLDLTSTWR